MENILVKQSQGIGVIGIHKFIKCDVTSKEAKALEKKIDKAIEAKDQTLTGKLLKQLKKRFMKSEMTYKNIVTTIGRKTLAQVITGDSAYTGNGIINFGALGDGTTTPANADVTLVNETFRKLIASIEVFNNIAILNQFYNSGQANAQHFESGEFIDATTTPDSGILFSRFLINELKTSTETLTIESTYTFIQ